MSDTITPDVFRGRFALAVFSDGGVVLDLETGSYSRVNSSAAILLEELDRADTTTAAVTKAADRLQIPAALALEHFRALTTQLVGEGLRHEPPDPFRYRRSHDGGYDLWHGDRLVLHADERGERLTLVALPPTLPLPVYDYVSAVAPKLLFLRGVTVLHASSWLRQGSLLGLSGKSRAGKTTTARTLAKHGGQLFSEDLLVLAADLSRPEAFLSGEATTHRWSHETSHQLERGSGWAGTDELVRAASGPTVPLTDLWFLDVRRRGDKLQVHQLGRSEGLVLVLANHFLGAAGPDSWRRHFAASRAISAAVTAYEVSVPAGLENLDRAIGAYTTNSAS